MEFISSLVVGKPLSILLVAVLFGLAHLIAQRAGVLSDRHPRSLLVVAAAWAAYALWEWLVVVFTPEANIRVDLMLIWPAVLIVSIWFTIRAFR